VGAKSGVNKHKNPSSVLLQEFCDAGGEGVERPKSTHFMGTLSHFTDKVSKIARSRKSVISRGHEHNRLAE
jgi:hypothetical protein